MAYSTHEQFLTMLERSKRPLILVGANANVDDFSSAFGVASLLSKLAKPVEIVTSGGTAPKAISFLKAPAAIRGDIQNIAKLTLKVKLDRAALDELSYHKDDDAQELHIHLLPKQGHWKPEDITIETQSYKYDLLICIGGSDLEQFGEIYNSYQDFFFKTPIINIDHSGKNEHYGQANVVDMSAVACAEVCYDLFPTNRRNFDR